jgi:hypothetical protein
MRRPRHCLVARLRVFQGELVSLVKPSHESIRRFSIGRDAGAIDGKKGVGDSEVRPLVVVDERVVLRKAFQRAAASSVRSAQ